MKRRQLLLGSGATLGGASILGTGAFTSVQAERSVTVNVAADADAFLRLAPCDSPNGDYVTGAGSGTMAIDLSDPKDNVGGSGVNPEARSVFDNVFQIANQGTQDVCVDFEVKVPQIPSDASVPGRYDFGSGDPAVVFYRGSDRDQYVINNRLDTDRDGAIKLPIDDGSSECIGFEVRAFGFDSDEDLFSGVDLTIRADADAECTVPSDGDVADPTPTGPTDGLVGYWPLGDIGEGPAVDEVGANDGEVTGTLSSASGRRGSAFDGSGDQYIEIGSEGTFGYQDFSVSVWAKATDINSGLQTVVARQNGNVSNPYQNRTFVIWFDDNNSFFGADVITSRTSETDSTLRAATAGGSTYTDDNWYHVVMTVAADETLKIYVGGEEKDSQDLTGAPYSGTADTWVGKEPGQSSNNGRPLNGAVSDLRIYNRALSPSEVQSLYDATSL